MPERYPRQYKHKADGNEEDNPGLESGFDKEIETLKRIETRMKMKVQNQ